MGIANILTLARISMIPLIAFFFYLPFQWAQVLTVIIFAIAAITDWLDGFLARSLSQTSKLGAFLDPVADKLVVVTALVLLVADLQLPFIAIPIAIIIGREIVVSALREWMAELGKRASVAVSFVGKIKTALQMIAVLLLLLGRVKNYEYAHLITLLGYMLIYLSALLTLWTMVMYLKAAWPEFVQSSKEKDV